MPISYTSLKKLGGYIFAHPLRRLGPTKHPIENSNFSADSKGQFEAPMSLFLVRSVSLTHSGSKMLLSKGTPHWVKDFFSQIPF